MGKTWTLKHKSGVGQPVWECAGEAKSKRKRQQHVSVSYSLLDLVPLLKHSSEFLHQYLIIKYTSNPVIHFFSKNFLRAYFVTIFLLQTLLTLYPTPEPLFKVGILLSPFPRKGSRGWVFLPKLRQLVSGRIKLWAQGLNPSCLAQCPEVGA